MPESPYRKDQRAVTVIPDVTSRSQVGVSVVIPSWDASRNANIEKLKHELSLQTVPPIEIKVIERTSPNGHARNVGVEQTSGEIIVFLDDDIGIGATDVFQVFAEYLTQNPGLGIVGTAQLLPPESNAFQRKCGEQLTRSSSAVVQQLTDSDMVTTQCCAMRRSVLEEVGGFHDKILRGVDPELRNRVREAGYRVAVVPNAWHFHPMPATLRALLRMAWRDGAASAYARKHYPETILFNPDGHVDKFEVRRSFPKRVANNLGRMARNALTGRWYGMMYGLVYACSNVIGGMKNRK
jgi:GT2 family glycosyltransferase